ncbi:MAG: hypothetical protein Q7K44_03215 [Candidatus Liptonbacteria bacterium]|nr:hypothetical protein [Candidatus Liptonbacteria bacterium]
MAIIIEEKTNGSGIVTFLIWLVILGIIAASAYYVFFKKPELVEFSASSNFKNIEQLSKISINSDQLINNPQFQLLKQYVTVSFPENIGRPNPFLGF